MVQDVCGYKTKWTIRRYKDDAAFKAGTPTPVPDGATGEMLPAVSYIEGNVLLTEGLLALCNLLVGVAETNFASTNAYLAVGESSAATARSHTDLQGASKVYVAVSQAPAISDGSGGDTGKKIVTWRSIFDGNTANQVWAEFTVASGSSGSADNLNRVVSAQGTKTTGQTWTLDLAITFG